MVAQTILALPRRDRRHWSAGFLDAAGFAATTILVWILHNFLPHATAGAWLYLPVVLALALRWGRGAGIGAALLAGLLILTFAVEPIGRPAAYHAADYAELAISGLGMLTAAVLTAELNGRRVATALLLAAESERGQEQQRHAQLLDTISDAFISVDTSWRYTYVNANAERLLRHTREELFGKTIGEVFPHGMDSPIYQRAAAALASQQPDRLEWNSSLWRQWFDVRIYPSSEGVSFFFSDITQRKQAEEAMLRLAAIVESSDDAIIGKTLDAIITSWNAGAERIYGYTAEEAIGRPISILIPPNRPDELPGIMARLRRGEHLNHYETERRTKDGRRLDVSVTISPVRDAAGEIIGASVVARDVTRRKRGEKERARLYRDAQDALHVRDEFLSSISHDLRTPLTTIRGLAQFLLRQLARAAIPPNEQLEKSLGDVDAAAGKMTAMIDELLDLSRLGSGRPLELNRQPMDLVALVRQLAAEHQRGAPDHRIIVNAAVEELNGSWDPVRLERALDNLLSNAVKYSPEGGLITVAVAPAEDSGDTRAALSVRDEGMGIPPADLPHIFERFHRGANVPQVIRGAGIGLAGAKQIVEQHGGTLSVESEEGRGSVFTMRLPL